MTIKLLIIDPQNDFCDLPPSYLPTDPLTGSAISPALPVPGAHADMVRVAQFIRAVDKQLDDIAITLDSHHQVGIERPTFWMTAEGAAVAPYTVISAADVESGRFMPVDNKLHGRVLTYLERLEDQSRYSLMVWPVHCEMGTWGHNVHADVAGAYNEWERGSQRVVRKIIKGTNPMTEHYSAVRAEVPLDDDASTNTNMELLNWVADAELVFIAGEAGSHCVKSTVEHLVELLPRDKAPKMVLLRDCISPVPGFEAAYEQFLQDMQARGVAAKTWLEACEEARALPAV